MIFIVVAVILVDHVYSVERNHFYDDKGKLIFDQVIFYEENGNVFDWRLEKDCRRPLTSVEIQRGIDIEIDRRARHSMQAKSDSWTRQGKKHTIDWDKYREWWKSTHHVSVFEDEATEYIGSSMSNPVEGTKILRFQDRKTQNKWREVHYEVMNESHTQHDPELNQRTVFPQDKRKGLVKP